MINTFRSILVMIADLILAVISFFLGMRVILELFSANPATPFVGWVYDISSSLMYPFAGLFPNLDIPVIGILDVTALVTLMVYSIIGYLVIGAIKTLLPVRVADDYYEHRHLA